MLRELALLFSFFSVFAWAHVEPGGRYVDKKGRTFTVHRPLGSGGYGVVYRATEAHSPLSFALKSFHDEKAAAEAARAHAFVDAIRGKSPFAERLLPSEVISYREEGGNPNRWDFGLRMPIMETDVHGVLDSLSLSDSRLSGDELSVRVQLLFLFFEPMLEAWAAFDHDKVLHRDISSRNFFLERNATRSAVFVYLADFDLVDSLASKSKFSVVGNPNTMAPELWSAHAYADLGSESDFFSLAATFFEMIVGKTIWENAEVEPNARSIALLCVAGRYGGVYEKAKAALASLLRVYQARIVRDWQERDHLAQRLRDYMEAILAGLTESREERSKRMLASALVQRVRARAKPKRWFEKLFCGTALAGG